MSGRLVVLAVAALAAIAAADTVRGWGTAPKRERPADQRLAEALHDAGGFVAAGKPRTRVLHRGRLYLTAEQIADAFPPPLEGVLFEIGHVASAPDGTVALAIYNFGTAEPPRNVIQFWRERRLVSAFPVSPGTFGGGIGFTQDGRFGARAPRGDRTTLFPIG